MVKKSNAETKSSGRQEVTFCIGIGASAGGLEAIEVFFKNMPEDTGLAFVVVQHLSPDYKSLMGELISRFTGMPVHTVHDGMELKPNNIFLIPAKKNMTVFDKTLHLSDIDQKKGLNLPIDIFFRSMALDFEKNSIGIVLSGTGSDGALGIRAIKEHGGTVFVQDNLSAKFDGMPKSSIATGMVDFILSPEEMPAAILHYIKHPYISKPDQITKSPSDENVLLKILKTIRERIGVDFTFYKPTTITRRLEKRLAINQIDNLNQYLELLDYAPREINILYKDLLIGVTQFFRDSEAFKIIEDRIIPGIFSGKKANEAIRIWSVGCSTGEEAYSIAMLLSEYMERNNIRREIKLFATDIDKEHIEIAGSGFYPESIIADVSTERILKFFNKETKGYRVKESLRRMVIFAQQNVIKDPPFSKIDLIICRNMLIYLNQDIQQRIISMFYYSLIPGGGLFLGSSETLGDLSPGFDVISNKWKIYRQKPGFKPALTNNYLQPLSQKLKLKNRRSEYMNSFNPNNEIPESILTDLLEYLMPSSVIVNDEFRVVHIFKDINEFIRIPAGKPRFDLLDMVPKEVSIVLSSMLHKVTKDNKEIIFKDLRLKEQNKLVNIIARPLSDKFNKRRFILVTFEMLSEDKKVEIKSREEKIDLSNQLSEHYIELEKELQFTKENLQATIEELETSNEELQSTNEELIASNEELQSTNEELQSVNEELYTVNTEHQNKIEELTQLNNDMNNLLKNTNVGILYLDKNLKIRKYTNLITRIINIMDMDIGRPINHISLNINYKGFLEDVQSVLETLKVKEIEVKDPAGNWNLIRIMPYRTEENAIEGITITVIDISKLRESQEQYKSLFESMLHGVVYQNSNGHIFSANPSAEKILGLTKDQMMGKTSMDPQWKSVKEDGSDFPGDEHPSMIALRTGKTVNNTVMGIYHPSEKEYKWININAIPEFREGEKKPYRVYTTFEDITKKINSERELKRNHELLYRILENSPIGKTVVDKNGLITYANRRAEEILGVKRKEIEKRKYNDIKWNITDLDGNNIPNQKLPVSLIMSGYSELSYYGMMTKDNKGNQHYLKVSGFPMLDAKGNPEGGIFNIEEITEDEARRLKSWKDF